MIKYSQTHAKRMDITFNKMIILLQKKGFITTSNFEEVENDFPLCQVTTETNLGEMRVHLYEDWLHIRFENALKASDIFGANVNRYSGKHNFHSLNSAQNVMNDIYNWFELQLDILKTFID